MDACLDDLVIAGYAIIDDLLADRRRMGRPPRLTDAELICLAIAQVLLGFDCERHWIRFVNTRLGHLFPYIPKAPGYNKRLRKAGPLLAEAIRHLASLSPSWHDGGVAGRLHPCALRRVPGCFASDLTSQIRVVISPHFAGSSACQEGYGHVRFAPWN